MCDIHIVFIIPEEAETESEASNTMKEAYNACKELVDDVTWSKESKLDINNLNKLNYVVFEQLDGRDFSEFIETKCAVVGPLAISTCLSESKPIPSFQWPILNVAMYNCIVTCSQLSKSSKEAIKQKVQLMGGLYTADFLGSVTHIICDGTTSEKYMIATERNVKIMLPGWINYLWTESQRKNIDANNSDILNKYKCPPFHKLIICTTGISSSKEKLKLQTLISTNGGEMVGKLNLNQTDVLICHGAEGTSSEKFKAAKGKCLPCVTIDWVYDSINKGFSLSYKLYEVKATTTSTPTKDSEDINPNFSCISSIGIPSNIQRSQINETMNSTGIMTDSKKRKASDDLVEKLDLKKVKSAGTFLDGCSIFLAGFSLDQRDKLIKAINLSGATRYDSLSERVTHVIIGNPCCPEVEEVRTKKLSCTVIPIQWFLDSIKQKQPAKEDDYVLGKEDETLKSRLGSPVSKKAINILKQNKLNLEENESVPVAIRDESDDTLTQQYLSKDNIGTRKDDTLSMLLRNANLPDVASRTESELNTKTKVSLEKSVVPPIENEVTADCVSSQGTTENSINGSVFCSYTFLLVGFDAETTDVLEGYVKGLGGVIVDTEYKDPIDFLVAPILKKPASTPFNSKEIVNELFVVESVEEEKLVDIQYYHRPLKLPTTRPLQDCVITISVYTSQERHFLKTLIEGLGGVFQEQFCRKNIPSKSVLASTHLVTPEASGKKYEAAVKWQLPAVTRDWLRKCVEIGDKADLNPFLVGVAETFSESSVTNANSSSSVSESSSKPSLLETPAKPEESVVPIHRQLANVNTPPVARKSSVNTPLNQIYNNIAIKTPDTCSQVTPINKILQDARDKKILPTPSPKTYYPWAPKTPDTPLGAFIRDNPSPALRKEMQAYVNEFPDFVPPPKRRLSTPLSELRRRLRNKVLYGEEYPTHTQESQRPTHGVEQELEKEEQNDVTDIPDNTEESEMTPEKEEANQKFQQLKEMVMASGSGTANRKPRRLFEAVKSREGSLDAPSRRNNEPQSQVCTIDWDYGCETESQAQKMFLLSGIELSQRQRLSDSIKALGGIVSEMATYDESCTHLICPKPLRNEKTLACMAAGKWILHTSYIEKSSAAGSFLNEHLFEFGNMQSKENIPYDEKDACINYWRKEIKRRGYGAFKDMRALVIAERRDPLVKVIEAGQGVVLNISPPFDEPIHATHCLLEAKVVKDFSQYTPLALQGIKCVNTIYIHEFLRKCGKEDTNYILPYFTSYYNLKDN
ncbi:DNA topoisomerase 2-binding protein 1-A isoform X2 [Sitophilus oryzae]|uniref:DNA topoisomerase 2-binding protein 1-A isoform X2 n=1 Tax=Sitophilus oryzae TaxID=7048 RepID=A0A6J2X834_SITOR|nr:DNA topoisomerase 2-binding protein 1-A isoform X2 [Sitophilus oryzae]